jgi:hypothetical protein
MVAFLQVVHALVVVCDIFTVPNENKFSLVVDVSEQSQQNVHGRCLCVQDYLDYMRSWSKPKHIEGNLLMKELTVVVVCVYYKYMYCKWWTLGAPGGLQAYSLPQPWLCRAPKVRKGGEGGACVSMETYNIKIHNIKQRCPSSDPILS